MSTANNIHIYFFQNDETLGVLARTKKLLGNSPCMK